MILTLERTDSNVDLLIRLGYTETVPYDPKDYSYLRAKDMGKFIRISTNRLKYRFIEAQTIHCFCRPEDFIQLSLIEDRDAQVEYFYEVVRPQLTEIGYEP